MRALLDCATLLSLAQIIHSVLGEGKSFTSTCTSLRRSKKKKGKNLWQEGEPSWVFFGQQQKARLPNCFWVIQLLYLLQESHSACQPWKAEGWEREKENLFNGVRNSFYIENYGVDSRCLTLLFLYWKGWRADMGTAKQTEQEGLWGRAGLRTADALWSPQRPHPSKSASLKALNYCRSRRTNVWLVLTDTPRTEITNCFPVYWDARQTVIHRMKHSAGKRRKCVGMWVYSKWVQCGWTTTTRRKEAESHREVRGFPLNHSEIPSYLLQFGSSSSKC